MRPTRCAACWRLRRAEGSPGGKTQVRIRGAEANHTLVLIDGIEANDVSDGDFDWSNLLAEDIERIEVIRGAQSGIYGSKAIGGVINIITKSGRGPLTLVARTEYGGYNTRDVAVRASGGTDRAWLAVSGEYRAQDDFDIAIFGTEDDPWRNSTFNAKGGVQFWQGMTLDFVVRNTEKFLHTDPEGLLPTGLDGAVDGAQHRRRVPLPRRRQSQMGPAGRSVLAGAQGQPERHRFRRAPTPSAGRQTWARWTHMGYLATYRFEAPMLLQSRHSVSGYIEHRDEGFTPTASYTDGLKRERARLATVAEYRGEFLDRVFVTGEHS